MTPLTLVLVAVAASAASAQHVYDVEVDPKLRQLDVRACFADGLPVRLIADHAQALKSNSDFTFVLNGESVVREASGRFVNFPEPSDDGCVAWQVDLDVVASAERLNVGYRTSNGLLLSPATWMWRPPQLTANRELIIRFHLPPGMQISVPWQPVKTEGNTQTFRHNHSPLDWPALMALGKLQTREFNVAGANFHLAVSEGQATVEAQRVEDWLGPAANAVSQLWGGLPFTDMQLLVIPVRDGYDAAPWAQTTRGGGAAVHFYMNAKASEKVLRDDWIATHEMVHFALPFIRRSDAWLSEGFASYYQNVLRARVGMISEQQAWKELYDGFARGNRDTEYDTLHDDTLSMHSKGRVMRVYWSGAAIALLADVELRRSSNGEWSLDRVLEEFARCCRERERTWSAREVFTKFDALAGTDIFDRLYRRNVYSRHFPRLAETLDTLGIEANDTSVRFIDTAPSAGIRRAIMAPRNTPSPETAAPGEWIRQAH